MKLPTPRPRALALLALAAASPSALAFVSPSPTAGLSTRSSVGASLRSPAPSCSRRRPAHALRLDASALAGGPLAAGGSAVVGLAKRAVGSIVPALRGDAARALWILLAALASALLAKRASAGTSDAVRNFLWPGSRADASVSAAHPLPEGSMGCPFVGHPGLFLGNKKRGPFAGLGKLSERFGAVFKSYTLGMPVVVISGLENVRGALKHEFRGDKGGLDAILIGRKNLGPLLGETGLIYESDPEVHAFLRRLVGSALTPAAIGAAMPSMQALAREKIERVLEADTIKMEEVAIDFTLDFAWKQILGLDLKEEEVPEFHRYVGDWTEGLMNPTFLAPFPLPGLMTLTKAGRARTYLNTKLEEKIAKLDRDGPDDSTFGKMYFATDDDGTTRLTRTQVIDNALVLIIAGYETSASTLACACLLFGLHPDAWAKVRAEQDEIRSEHGEDLTPAALEECRYLDAAIRETLRIHPLAALETRKVSKTIVVDGKQIPKGWNAVMNVKQTHANDPKVYEEDGSHMDDRSGFVPERWLDESTAPSEWMPFGEGRRRCVGERLSFAEMKVFLASLAREVESYELVRGYNDGAAIEWKGNAMMYHPADGVEVRPRPVAKSSK